MARRANSLPTGSTDLGACTDRPAHPRRTAARVNEAGPLSTADALIRLNHPPRSNRRKLWHDYFFKITLTSQATEGPSTQTSGRRFQSSRRWIMGSPARLGVTSEASHREVPAIEPLLGQAGRVASCSPPRDKPLAGRPWGSGAARRASSGSPVVQGPSELERLQVIRPLDPGFGSALWQGIAGHGPARRDHHRTSDVADSPPNDEESRIMRRPSSKGSAFNSTTGTTMNSDVW